MIVLLALVHRQRERRLLPDVAGSAISLQRVLDFHWRGYAG